MTFALITEGPSEYNIINRILAKFFKEADPDINPIQPKIINSKQETPGGWNEVLKYCERTEDLKNIFVDNDYLIIQIDTDRSQDMPFDISHTKPGNTEKTVAELQADVVAKLTGLIAPEILQAYGRRIFFAICVHTIECWLLPIYSGHHKSAIKSCIAKLNTELGKRNLDSIPTATKDKNSFVANRTYNDILKSWKRKQDIIDAAQHNAGFKLFTDALASINEQKG